MKPSIPQGTRDFDALTVRKRQYILNTIKSVFELYGFAPLETPAMENLDTLMGKYGEEGDKLIFKILNNGLDNPEKESKSREAFEKILQGKNSSDLTERALKYDLTIPFARYVAMNHGKLSFPFKRYQMQPVWRADRPQKGRYREFTQCDADVVGSTALLNEVELALIYHTAFVRLGLAGYNLSINSRKILTALAEHCGGVDKMMDITIAIDKLDKIGIDKVKEELQQRGLTEQQVALIEQYLQITGTDAEKLAQAKALLGDTATGAAGIAEVEQVIGRVQKADAACNITADFTLARGLNYYTGIIFEAKGPAAVKMGSIGGGGRYDDLTGLFGVPDIPGVGISFGIDRIYDVLEELQLFPANLQVGTQVLFFNLGENESAFAFTTMQQLRNSGIACELYHEVAKMDKQFKYAEKKNIPFAIIIGSRELEQQQCMVKNLQTGQQESMAPQHISSYIQS
jgi:histidyl-tRNA synthetase